MILRPVPFVVAKIAAKEGSAARIATIKKDVTDNETPPSNHPLILVNQRHG